MRVVIVGARTRNETTDTGLVNQIIDTIKEKYSTLIVVVSSCDRGVGRIIRSRNLTYKETNGSYEFDLMEIDIKHYLNMELPRTEFTSHWNALNSLLIELGDEFHILTEDIPRGSISNLLTKVKENGRRYATYKPSEVNGGIKECKIS